VPDVTKTIPDEQAFGRLRMNRDGAGDSSRVAVMNPL